MEGVLALREGEREGGRPFWGRGAGEPRGVRALGGGRGGAGEEGLRRTHPFLPFPAEAGRGSPSVTAPMAVVVVAEAAGVGLGVGVE